MSGKATLPVAQVGELERMGVAENQDATLDLRPWSS